MSKPPVSVKALAGAGVGSRRSQGLPERNLPGWVVKAGRRLAQQCRKPGVYPVIIIVRDDGSREMIVKPGKTEDLGK